MAISAALVGTKGTASGTLTTGAGTTTSGSTFVIGIRFDATVTRSTAGSALDNKGNTYTQVGTTLNANGAKSELWYCSNGTGGASHTASAAFSGSSFGTIYLIQITGAAAASFDKTAQGTDADTPFTIATPTLTQANEVVITLVGNGNGNNPMSYASSNTTILDQEGDGTNWWTSAISAQVVASTASFVPSFTSAASTSIHALITATFKEAVVSGNPNLLRRLNSVSGDGMQNMSGGMQGAARGSNRIIVPPNYRGIGSAARAELRI